MIDRFRFIFISENNLFIIQFVRYYCFYFYTARVENTIDWQIPNCLHFGYICLFISFYEIFFSLWNRKYTVSSIISFSCVTKIKWLRVIYDRPMKSKLICKWKKLPFIYIYRTFALSNFSVFFQRDFRIFKNNHVPL